MLWMKNKASYSAREKRSREALLYTRGPGAAPAASGLEARLPGVKTTRGWRKCPGRLFVANQELPLYSYFSWPRTLQGELGPGSHN